MHLPKLTCEANDIPSSVTPASWPRLGGCPVRSGGGSGCDHCHGIAVPQQDELGWGEKLGMNRLRMILVAALHYQHLRLSSRVREGEVRGTCQIGIGISQTLHLLSLLVLPPRKGLPWWWWLKVAGRSPREQGNLLGKRSSAATKKGGRTSGKSLSPAEYDKYHFIALFLYYFSATLVCDQYPKAILQQRNKRKVWSPTGVTVHPPGTQQVVELDYA